MAAVRIGSYKLRKSGNRGSSVAVPAVYLEDAKLRKGKEIGLWRLGKLLIMAPPGVSVDQELEVARGEPA